MQTLLEIDVVSANRAVMSVWSLQVWGTLIEFRIVVCHAPVEEERRLEQC